MSRFRNQLVGYTSLLINIGWPRMIFSHSGKSVKESLTEMFLVPKKPNETTRFSFKAYDIYTSKRKWIEEHHTNGCKLS